MLLEFVRGVLAPTLFSACMDWILGRMSERSSCSVSFGNVKMSDLDFTDDAVILLGALKVLNEESETLGLRVSWVKTKIQAFNDVLDAAILSAPVCQCQPCHLLGDAIPPNVPLPPTHCITFCCEPLMPKTLLKVT